MSEITARREARMKRILENSDKRLQKIMGVQNRVDSYVLEGYKSSSCDFKEPAENGLYSSLPLNDTVHSHDSLLQREYVHNNDLVYASSIDTNVISSQKETSYFTTHRMPIIILIALFTNVLLSFFENYNSSVINNIFITLLGFESIDLLSNNSPANENVVKFFVLFKYLPPHQIARILKYLAKIQIVFKDVMVYFFVFVSILLTRCIFTGNLNNHGFVL